MIRITIVILALLGPLAIAQSVHTEMTESDGILGPLFESTVNGIALRAPAGMKPQATADQKDIIVQFASEDKSHILRASRIILNNPTSLSVGKDAMGNEIPGILEKTAAELKKSVPDAEFLRQDLVNITDADVGMIVLRYTQGSQRRLTQQAIIAADKQLYYVLNMTSPGAVKDATGEDAREKLAVDTFRLVLDSVKIIDTTSIRDDQDQRLYRTRGLFTNWTEERIKKALEPEQWFRILRDGKDLGYIYISTEIQKLPLGEGLGVGIRVRTMPEKGTQLDISSHYFCTYDRRHETWTNSRQTTRGDKVASQVEQGCSDQVVKTVIDRDATTSRRNPLVPEDKSNYRQTTVYTLDATRISPDTAAEEPIKRQLPPWYLPQALGQLLPKLLPLSEPRTYMFACWVSERGEVMSRYIDIGREQDVTLLGKKHRAVPISDRIGLEGTPCVHYVSTEGIYLGSQTVQNHDDGKKQTILIVPSTEESLKNIWHDIDMSRAPDVKVPPKKHPGK